MWMVPPPLPGPLPWGAWGEGEWFGCAAWLCKAFGSSWAAGGLGGCTFDRQGHLAGTREIINQVSHLLVAKSREQTFRHHAQLALANLGDLVARNCHDFIGRLQHDAFVSHYFDNPGEVSSVFGFDFAGAIFIRDHGVGIENVFQ